jgi:hypothetical protein
LNDQSFGEFVDQLEGGLQPGIISRNISDNMPGILNNGRFFSTSGALYLITSILRIY